MSKTKIPKTTKKLNKGERQRSNGLFEYRYTDKDGIRRSVSSWRLTSADLGPKGKESCKPLREIEKEIIRDKTDGISTHLAKNSTLNERFDLYIKSKIGLKPSTKQNYIYMYDRFVRKDIGRMSMGDIQYSIIKNFYIRLIETKGLKPNSMETIHTILNPVFDEAVLDGIVRSNPCCPAMKQIRSLPTWVSKKVSTKNALTESQQKAFVDYLRNDDAYARWVNIITILLGTGMRIGECTGLTWSDVDFEKNVIYITHTLVYRKWEDGACYYRVMSTPKTTKGIRQIPMFEEVREAFLAEKEWQEKVGTADTVIDGYRNWVFTNRYGTVLSPTSVNDAIERIIRNYNREEEIRAKEDGRAVKLIPHTTNHLLRHCFCTRLVEETLKPDSKINLKLIQEIMGHANFSTTMDIYTDVSERIKKEAMLKMQDDIYLG